MPTFPSTEDREHLKDRLVSADWKWSVLSDRERQHWHAYDYAWRAIFLHDGSGNSPIDPQRRWYDELLVRQATELYAARYRRVSREWISPADEAEARGDLARAAAIRVQDSRRHALLAAIVGDGRLADGSPGAELLAFLECCKEQIAANTAEFGRGVQRRDVVREVREVLGVSSAEVDRDHTMGL